MIKINIIGRRPSKTEGKKWILDRYRDEMVAHGKKSTIEIVENSRTPCDIDYVIPYQKWKQCVSPIKVGLFTHRETAEVNIQKRHQFEQAANEMNYCIAMSQSTAEELRHLGVAESKLEVMHFGSELFKYPKTFGVCGRTESRRKNENWIWELSKHAPFLAWGKGWPCQIFEGSREDFYKKIDYLVVTSNNEGGPVPVIEAIQMGVPIIAPDVGWCWEYPVIQYKKNNLEDLRRVILRLTIYRNWFFVWEDLRIFFNRIYAEN